VGDGFAPAAADERRLAISRHCLRPKSGTMKDRSPPPRTPSGHRRLPLSSTPRDQPFSDGLDPINYR
jgi:hypothetical protein